MLDRDLLKKYKKEYAKVSSECIKKGPLNRMLRTYHNSSLENAVEEYRKMILLLSSNQGIKSHTLERFIKNKKHLNDGNDIGLELIVRCGDFDRSGYIIREDLFIGIGDFDKEYDRFYIIDLIFRNKGGNKYADMYMVERRKDIMNKLIPNE